MMRYDVTPELLKPPELWAAKIEAAKALRAAADTIDAPHAWTQGVRARNARGVPVGPLDPAAVRFCMIGALDLHMDRQPTAVSMLAHRAVAEQLDGVQISAYNDAARSGGQCAQMLRMAAHELIREV